MHDLTPEECARMKQQKTCQVVVGGHWCLTHDHEAADCFADLHVDRTRLLTAYEQAMEENERLTDTSVKFMGINTRLTAQVQALEAERDRLRGQLEMMRHERDDMAIRGDRFKGEREALKAEVKRLQYYTPEGE